MANDVLNNLRVSGQMSDHVQRFVERVVEWWPENLKMGRSHGRFEIEAKLISRGRPLLALLDLAEDMIFEADVRLWAFEPNFEFCVVYERKDGILTETDVWTTDPYVKEFEKKSRERFARIQRAADEDIIKSP